MPSLCLQYTMNNLQERRAESITGTEARKMKPSTYEAPTTLRRAPTYRRAKFLSLARTKKGADTQRIHARGC